MKNVLASFSAADKVIIVTQPYGAEPYRVRKMYEELTKGGDRDKVRSKTHLLVNKVERNTDEVKQLDERFGFDIPKFNVVIPKGVGLTRIKPGGGKRSVAISLEKELCEVLEKFYLRWLSGLKSRRGTHCGI